MTTPLLGDLLQQGAAASPHRPLVHDDTASYTVGEVWDFSRRLTGVLDDLGLQVGARISLVADRDAATIRLVLALPATGRTVHVVDPARDDVDVRLRRSCGDLVLDQRADARRPEPGGPPRTPLELTGRVSTAQPGQLPEVRPSDLAYVIFTSGSTSTAKAAAVTQGSLAVATQDWLGTYGVPDPSGGGVLQFAGTSFDPFYSDLARAVAGRYRLVVCPDRVRVDPAATVDLMRRERIGMVELTPAVTRLVLDELESGGAGLPDLHHLAIGGEAWRVGELRRIRRLLPGCRVLNTYGLVETTIDNFCHDAADELPGIPDGSFMPLGRPFAHCEYAVGPPEQWADAAGPRRGELWIGGPYVAAGYLRDDGSVDSTAFRHDDRPWFATGDVVREDAAGRLWYVGRTGSTVKIHGTRVDLDEVDAVLLGDPAVAQVATVLADVDTGLIASVYVPRGQAAPPARLRARVSEALGALAAPTLVLHRTSLPLNASGKVDRRALTAWARSQWVRSAALPTADATDAPAGPPLAFLLDLCRTLSGIDQADPDAPAGDLGLDSLHLVQLLAALGRRYGCTLPSELVFARPTLRQLADEAAARSGTWRRPRPRSSPRHRLTGGQQELLLHDALHDDPAAYVVPWIVDVTGHIDAGLIEEALRAVVAAHEPLRSHYGWSDAGWFAEPVEASPRLEPVDPRTGPTVPELLLRPFDLAAELPIRAWWVSEPGADAAQLVIAVHHVATDGGAGQLVLDQLARAAESLATGRPPELAAPVPSFGDLAEAASEEQQDVHVEYWRGVLGGFRATADRNPAVRRARSLRFDVRLDHDLVRALRHLAHEEETTPFAVLMTAVAECERRWSGATDVLVGYPVSRRESAWTSPLVGLLTDTAVARSTGGGATGREAVRATRGVLQANAAHLGASCSAALRELSRASGQPAFSTWLNFLGPPDQAPRLPGVLTEMVEPPTAPALFARNLYVTDHGDTMGIAGVFAGNSPPELARDQLDQVVLAIRHVVTAPDRPVDQANLVTPAARTVRTELPRAAADRSPAIPGAPGRRALGDAAGWLDHAEVRRAVEERQPKAVDVGGATRLLPMERTRDRVLDLVALLTRPGRVALWNPELPSAWQAHVVEALRTLDEPPPGSSEYALPTSGTTGLPKPVVADVPLLLTMLDDYVHALGIGADDRFVLTAALAHDPVLRDVLVPLTTGGSLFVPSAEDWLDPVRLFDVLVTQEPTIVNLTPQLGRLLAGASAGRTLPSVRAVVVSGDVLRVDDVAALRRVLPHAQVHHGYGLTESPQLPSLAPVPERCDEVLLAPGRPGSEVQVLDALGRPCGLGQPGQVHIRSRHLSPRAAPPVPDVDAGARDRPLRRLATSDRGELVGGGYVRFLGRADERVTVNGRLVDPRLIDAAIAEDSRVVDVATVLLPSAGGDELVALVGLVTGAAGDHHLDVELRRAVRSRLPRHYVPQRIVMLNKVPRGANGKVDRLDAAALAGRSGDMGGHRGRPPETSTERALAELWQVQLGRPFVPVDENFFDLGGSSMLLLRVHHAMRRRWPSCPGVLTCYEHPTVAELADFIDRARAVDVAPADSPPPVRVRPRGHRLAERDRRIRARHERDGRTG